MTRDHGWVSVYVRHDGGREEWVMGDDLEVAT